MNGHRNIIHKNHLINFTLFLASSVVSLIILEWVSGLFFSSDEYKVWYPNVEFSFNMKPGLLPGVNELVEFQINSEGMIGDTIYSDATYRILAVGGSTTECLMLGSKGGWPYLLQNKLNQNYPKSKVWVGNLGRSGLHSEDHVLAVKHLLPQLPKIDALIVLAGVNDLQKRMTLQKDYESFGDPNLYSHAFHIYPNKHNGSFLKKTNIWALLKKFKKYYQLRKNREMSHDQVESFYQKKRERRKDALKLEELPDVTNAVDNYKERISEIIQIARSQNIRVIFLTQPTIWKENFPEGLKKYLLTGGDNIPGTSKQAAYYSVKALANGMELYNQKLLEACGEANVESIDLASIIPRDITYFYDDMHFNKKGAAEVSNVLNSYFLEKGM
ncbi:SGNH/GDSL hydrolase family protein [Ekhidna sp. To15]|uniref:SGNH/GDSL hydrolase family protein n=1 Tax=Ekhidna sp. To15 TaxID=3395267 RepID=UPI003F51E619